MVDESYWQTKGYHSQLALFTIDLLHWEQHRHGEARGAETFPDGQLAYGHR